LQLNECVAQPRLRGQPARKAFAIGLVVPNDGLYASYNG
jgi:hypothetical protein